MADTRCTRLGLVVLLGMLARCATQEAQTDASPAQERVEMLRGLCAQAGLDVSGVVDEAQLLARIAAHPPALDALRVGGRARVHAGARTR